MPQRAKVRRVWRLEEGDVLGQAEAQADAAPPSSMPASSRPSTSPAVDRAVGDAALRRLDLDQSAPASTGRASRCARSRRRARACAAASNRARATSSAPTRQRAGSRGMKTRGVIACASCEQRVELRLVEPADHASPSSIADGRAWHRARGNRPARASRGRRRVVSPSFDAELRLGTRGKRIAAGRLAGLGAAQLQHMAARPARCGSRDRR